MCKWKNLEDTVPLLSRRRTQLLHLCL